MSRHTVERDLVGARTLTGANQFTAFTSRFKDQSAVRFRGAFLQPIVRGDRTRFFVGVVGHADRETVKVFLAGVLECELVQRFFGQILQSVENGHATGFAVQDTRTIGTITLDRHRADSHGAGRENRIQVGVEHHVIVCGFGLVGSEKSGTDLVAQVNETGSKANAFVVLLERFSNLLHTFGASRAGVYVNDLFQVLEKFLNHRNYPF